MCNCQGVCKCEDNNKPVQVQRINPNNDPMIIGTDYEPPDGYGLRKEEPSQHDNSMPPL